MYLNKFSWLIIFFFLSVPIAYCQTVTIDAELDSSSIIIGDQAILHIQITKPVAESIVIPQFTDTLVKGIDIISITKIDTTLVDDKQNIQFSIYLTSFEPGDYTVPAIKFVGENDTYQTPLFPLLVKPFNINPDDEKLNDIKPILQMPFSWKTFFKWTAIVLLVLALVAGIVYILVKYVFKKKIPLVKSKEEIIPPHIIAIQELDKIKAEKLWQQGKVKEYYSAITDVIRVYLERRFDIPALEMTTHELVKLISTNPETLPIKDTLSELLHLSDIVKFAKYIPLNSDNDLSLIHSYFIIDKTKIEPITEPTSEKDM